MFTLDHVVPWGRSFDEYRRMFALTERDLRLRLVGCADGPASFNAEATRRGTRVVSCDPLYRWAAAQIQERIDATCGEIVEQTRRNTEQFIWTGHIRSVDDLREVRMTAMRQFLEDYEGGRLAGRYLDAELPTLPFDDGAFDLALCSHFLFLYSRQLNDAFHFAAILEMCRVAGEARIFPLVSLEGLESPWVEPVETQLRRLSFAVSREIVPYEFQRGGNQMMRVRNR